VRYTDWVSLNELFDAPVSGGLFQIKIRDQLLLYPTGKSAMFYYGFAENLEDALRKFKDEFVPVLGADARTLMVRWMAVDGVTERFRKQLKLFHTNFGSLPEGNEIWLQKMAATVKKPAG